MSLWGLLKGRSPKDHFAKRVMERLEAAGWPHSTVFDPVAFTIALGGEAGVLSLSAAFNEWQPLSRADQDAYLDDICRFAFEKRPERSYDEAASSLLPIVRNRSHLFNIWLERSGTAIELNQEPHFRLGETLALLVAEDWPKSLVIVNAATLGIWEKPFAEVLERAVENVRAKPAKFEEIGPKVYVSDCGDFYDASRILVPDVFGRMDLVGAPVVIAIARDTLIVVGSEDNQGLNAMARFAVEALEEHARPISYEALILTSEGWRTFVPDNPALANFSRLMIKQAIEDYGAQRDIFQAFLKRQGRVESVAALHVADGDIAHTWCEWSEGEPALLPRADVIRMRARGGETLERPWNSIASICGGLEREGEIHPPYFRTGEWPSSENWSMLMASPP